MTLSVDAWFAKATLILALVAPGALAAQTPQSFNRTAWEADYHALKIELERNYSHLAWFGSPEGGVDLPSLNRVTQDALTRSQLVESRGRTGDATTCAMVTSLTCMNR